MNIKLILISLWMLLAMDFSTTQVDSEIITTNKIDIGSGYNPLNQQAMASPIVYTGNSDLTTTGGYGNETKFSLARITTIRQLKEELDLNISTSFSYGVMKGNAKMKSLEQSIVNKYSDFLLVKVEVRNQPEMLKNTVLTDAALHRLTNYGVENFIDHYGSQFVYSRVTGGYCYFLYEFSSTSESQRKENRVKIDLAIKKFFGASGKLSVDVKKQLSSLFETSNVSYIMNRVGDNSALPNYNDISKVIDYLVEFPAKVKNEAGDQKFITLEVMTRSIFTAINWPPTAKPIDAQLLQRRRYIKKLGRKLLKVYEANGNLNYILEHPEYFKEEDVVTAEKYLDENLENAILIQEAAEDCSFYSEKCYSLNPEKINIHSFEPKRKGKTIVVVPPPPPPKFKNIQVALHGKSNQEQLITKIPFGESRTIEVRGKWVTHPSLINKTCDKSGIEFTHKVIPMIDTYRNTKYGEMHHGGVLIVTDLDGKNKREINLKNDTPIRLSSCIVYAKNVSHVNYFSCKEYPMRILVTK